MSHRRRYAVTTTRETVVDLLALDTLNPRSVLYHLTEIRDHVAFLPDADGQRPDVAALARRAAGPHRPRGRDPRDRRRRPRCARSIREIEALSDLLSDTYLR